MNTADFLIVGGGVAGLSAASRLARHGKAVVLEAEDALGYHASGRSVSFSHFGIGNETVRGLTAWSQRFFEAPPEGFATVPLCQVAASIWLAREEMLDALEALYRDMSRFTDAVRYIGPDELSAMCPVLRTGPGAAVRAVLDPHGLKLDSDALLQSYARAVRSSGGEVLTGRRIACIEQGGELWRITTEGGEKWETPLLLNAAGAWADRIAALAGVRPIGILPRRRTIIVVDPPAGTDVSGWPFVHTAAADFYMLPEAGQILASPVDEVEDDPCDAQPEEYDLALAAWQLEQYTTLTVERIAHRWAGLRSFVADRVPTAGFDEKAPGFFWLVGQGGYGLQTSPAMAAIVEAQVIGKAWPAGLAELGVTEDRIGPARLRPPQRPAT
jgi:D-arginine dehydrogenase